eukprot:m.29489 g.29489  ORF g.29489 m.29489 type:complete len:344 (+) comp4668_c0_seq1:205-1236(+)
MSTKKRGWANGSRGCGVNMYIGVTPPYSCDSGHASADRADAGRAGLSANWRECDVSDDERCGGRRGESMVASESSAGRVDARGRRSSRSPMRSRSSRREAGCTMPSSCRSPSPRVRKVSRSTSCSSKRAANRSRPTRVRITSKDSSLDVSLDAVSEVSSTLDLRARASERGVMRGSALRSRRGGSLMSEPDRIGRMMCLGRSIWERSNAGGGRKGGLIGARMSSGSLLVGAPMFAETRRITGSFASSVSESERLGLRRGLGSGAGAYFGGGGGALTCVGCRRTWGVDVTSAPPRDGLRAAAAEGIMVKPAPDLRRQNRFAIRSHQLSRMRGSSTTMLSGRSVS